MSEFEVADSHLTDEEAERGRVEEDGHERRRYLEAILAAAPDAVIALDLDHRVLEWNPGAERLFGYSAKEAVGKLLNTLIAGPKTPVAEEAIAYTQAVSDGLPIAGVETIRYGKDGTAIPVVLSAAPTLIEDRVVGAVGIYTDISQQRAAEEALRTSAQLREARDLLEVRVKARTAELTQANEEIRQFAYIVSHDLRAPLVNLKGFSTELRYALDEVREVLPTAEPYLDPPQRERLRRALDEDATEALDFIESSVSRMDHFISAVLTLSRLGHRELRPEDLDVEALVHEALIPLTHQIEQYRVTVTVGDLPRITADRTSMEQIMGNILGNALKYLVPDRPGELCITADESPEWVAFHIRDNGRGIAEDDMPKVFAPFRRAGRQDVPGDGMGLAYVQALIRRSWRPHLV